MDTLKKTVLKSTDKELAYEQPWIGFTLAQWDSSQRTPECSTSS